MESKADRRLEGGLRLMRAWRVGGKGCKSVVQLSLVHVHAPPSRFYLAPAWSRLALRETCVVREEIFPSIDQTSFHSCLPRALLPPVLRPNNLIGFSSIVNHPQFRSVMHSPSHGVKKGGYYLISQLEPLGTLPVLRILTAPSRAALSGHAWKVAVECSSASNGSRAIAPVH